MDTPNLAVVVKQVVGPVLIGVVIHALLLGVVGCQYVQYFTSNFKDSKWLKFTVAWMALIDLLLMMNSAALLWYYAVENFADPTVLDGSAWNFNMLPFFCTLSAFPVQVFLADRIRKFSGSSTLFAALVVLILAGAAPGWVSAIKVQMDSNMSRSHRATFLKFISAWGGISLGCDTVLTALMTYFLWQKRTAFQRTNKILNRYMQVGIQSALPVTICAALVLILSRTLTTTNIHYIFSVNLGRLYSIILLTVRYAQVSFSLFCGLMPHA
ncbi:hypothetical protein CPB85DRAFT_743104 [Mucidula mucida]|nr:hypothetical protein CPB85DRAFT_743104 [Mucidula mucida]